MSMATDRNPYVKYRANLVAIHNRYFRRVISDKGGVVVHHGDCEIFRSREMYGFAVCTCGLIHDLRWLPGELAERVYPQYGEDRSREDDCWEPDGEGYYKQPFREKMTKEQADQFLRDMGFTPSDEPVVYDEEAIWATVKSVFGSEPTSRMKTRYQQYTETQSVG